MAGTASNPDDICPADADPCVVSGLVIVDDFVDLDFGGRTVVVERGGRLALNGHMTMFAGGLMVEEGGTLDLTGRHHDSNLAFIDLIVSGHCADAPEVSCYSSFDCSTGECVGNGFTMLGRVDARRRNSAWLTANIVGDVTIDGLLDFSTREAGGVGGDLQLYATGSIEFRGEHRARGRGYDGGGGYLYIIAGGDIRAIDARFDLNGGDFDGGGLTLQANGDVLFSGEVQASSKKGGGYGGYVDLYADRDAIVTGQSNGDPSTFVLRGHRASGGFSAGYAGDGGTLIVSGRRNAFVSEAVQIDVQSGATAEDGGYVGVSGYEHAELDADIDASTPAGVAGAADVSSVFGTISIGSQASIRLDGEFGGTVDLDADGAITMAGEITSTNTGTRPATISIVSDEGDVTISGSLHTYAEPVNYLPNESIEIEGCNVSLLDGALASLDSNGYGIRVVSREAMLVDATSSLLAAGSVSTIDLVHRDPMQPPTLLGIVSPTPSITVDPYLSACP
jgi:hypothetical protein